MTYDFRDRGGEGGGAWGSRGVEIVPIAGLLGLCLCLCYLNAPFHIHLTIKNWPLSCLRYVLYLP